MVGDHRGTALNLRECRAKAATGGNVAVQDDGHGRASTADAHGALSRLAPRLTSRVLLDLRIWMMGFGLLIGIVFPFAVVPLGVPHDVAIRPAFFAATILAGLLVGAINTALVQVVVGVRLRALAVSMRRVELSMRAARRRATGLRVTRHRAAFRSTPPTSSASLPTPSTSSLRAWQPVTG